MVKFFCCFPCSKGTSIENSLIKAGIVGNSSIIRGKSLKIPKHQSVTEYFSRSLISGTVKAEGKALIHDGFPGYSFDELEFKSTRLAKALKEELDLKEWTCSNEDGDLVIGFCLGNTEVMVTTLFAILKLGAAYLPIDPLTPEEHLVRIVGAVRPILIVTEAHEPIVSRFEVVAHLVHIVKINKILEIARKIIPDKNDVVQLASERKSWERMAAIYYTSGVSGRRRGVRISHQAILNRVMWQWDTIPYDENDIACLLSQSVIHTSIPDIFAPLLNGTPLVILNRALVIKPDFLISNLSQYKVTRVTVTTSILSNLITEIESSDEATSKFLINQLSTVRCWICSGDSLSKDLCYRFFTCFGDAPEGDEFEVNGKRIPRLIHLYGATETTAGASYEVFYSSVDVDGKSLEYEAPCGIPIANTIIYILSDSQKVLPMNSKGEICVSGLCLASRYILSDIVQKFLPNHLANSEDYSLIYRTGDLGRIAEDSEGVRRLYHEGHKTLLVQVKGKQVDLNIIARAIRNSGLVEDVEILIFHPEKDDQVIIAAVILKPDVIPADVSHAVQNEVDDNLCIPEIFPVPSFPTWSDGHTNIYKLMDAYKATRNVLETSNDWGTLNLPLPQQEAGKTLCEIVALSIGVPVKHIITNFEDSFWNLGGNSSNVILTVSRLRGKQFHITLEEFIMAEYLPAILNLMIESQENNKPDLGIQSFEHTKNKYLVQSMREADKEVVFVILCRAYSETGRPVKASYLDMHDFLEDIWKDVLKQNLSITVKTKEKKEIVAVSINMDANALPTFKKMTKAMKYTLDLYDKCEQSAKARLINSSRKGKLIEPFMMGTSVNMTPGEKTLLIQLLLKETIQKGIQHSFTHIFIASDAAIMRQMCRNVIKCDILLEFPINSFVAADNTKPFNLTGSYFSITVYAKGLKK